MSYGVLECDIVVLQNYMLMTCDKIFCNKRGVICAGLCITNKAFASRMHEELSQFNKKNTDLVGEEKGLLNKWFKVSQMYLKGKKGTLSSNANCTYVLNQIKLIYSIKLIKI